KSLSTWGRNPERTPMRKAQFGYGWDWGPRLPTIGIWRPVRMERQQRAALAGVHAWTVDITPDRRRAAIAVHVEVERFATHAPLVARVELRAPDGASVKDDLELTGDRATAYLTVDAPELWWTHELGNQPLYHLRVQLTQDDTLLDTDERSVGIR